MSTRCTRACAPHAGPTVLTRLLGARRRFGGRARAARRRLLDLPWSDWADAVVDDLAPAHPDVRAKVTQVDLMRYGHAMSIPLPGVRSSAALRALAEAPTRVHFAHADLSGYSIFEEALYQGARAARAVLRGQGARVSGAG